MRKLPAAIGAICLVLLGTPGPAQNLWINEFLASNDSIYPDNYGEFEDWVELYNPGDTAIDLGGYYFTDDLNQPDKWQVPTNRPDSTTIPPGGFMVFFFDKDPEQGVLHVNAKLNATGEDIGIFDANLNPIDTVSFGPQTPNISQGRPVEGDTIWTFFPNPTPGAPNAGGASQAAPPIFSKTSGIFNAPFQLSLFNTTPGTAIYYTTDGSLPTVSSAQYQTPIPIDSSMTVRAIVKGGGYVPSEVITQAYLIGVHHNFPVTFLTFDPKDFYDTLTGIYTNWDQDLKAEGIVTFFETDGSMAFQQPTDIKIQGSSSAEFPHKSLSLKAHNYLGKKKFQYPVFPDQPFDEYRSFLLRNSGQDWDKTFFRDAYSASLVADLRGEDTILSPPKLYLQAYRPTIAYFNGEYRGIYNIRERLDKGYMKQHFGLEPGEYDFMEGVDGVKKGDWDDWLDFMNFLLYNDMSVPANYDSLQKRLDVDAYMDYVIFNIYLNNVDWPANNSLRWREKSPDGKWRWLVSDLDFTYSLVNVGDTIGNSGDYTINALERLYNDSGWEWPNPEWSTRVFRACVQNDQWRHRFINRMADQLNVLYTPQRMYTRLNEFKSRYAPETAAHICKWFDCFLLWDQNIDVMKYFISGRQGAVRTHFLEKYPELTDTVRVTLDVEPAGSGRIEFSTLHLSPDNLPWSGMYFAGIDIPVKAIPADGYEFVGWSDATLTDAETQVVFPHGGNRQLTAHFQKIVATNEPSGQAPSLTPNPCTDYVTITVPESCTRLIVTDIAGHEIVSRTASGQRVQIETAQWAPGIYWVQLRMKRRAPFIIKLVRQ